MIHTEGASKEEGAREEIMGKMSIKWMVGTVVVAAGGGVGLAGTRVMGGPAGGDGPSVPSEGPPPGGP